MLKRLGYRVLSWLPVPTKEKILFSITTSTDTDPLVAVVAVPNLFCVTWFGCKLALKPVSLGGFQLSFYHFFLFNQFHRVLKL